MSELLLWVCCPHLITQSSQKHLHIHLRPIRKPTVTSSQLQADRQKPPPFSQWLSNWVRSGRYPELSSKQPLLGLGTESSHLPLPSLILKVPVHFDLLLLLYAKMALYLFTCCDILRIVFCLTVPGHVRTCPLLVFRCGCVLSA